MNSHIFYFSPRSSCRSLFSLILNNPLVDHYLTGNLETDHQKLCYTAYTALPIRWASLCHALWLDFTYLQQQPKPHSTPSAKLTQVGRLLQWGYMLFLWELVGGNKFWLTLEHSVGLRPRELTHLRFNGSPDWAKLDSGKAVSAASCTEVICL